MAAMLQCNMGVRVEIGSASGPAIEEDSRMAPITKERIAAPAAPVANAAAATPQAFEQAVADIKETVASATAAATAASPALAATAIRPAQQVAANAARAADAAREFAAFNQASVEAVLESGRILSAGARDMFRQAAESTQGAFVEVLSGYRALATVKSAKEGIELQANLARTAANWALAEYGRFALAGLKVAEDASAPLTAQAVRAAEKLSAFRTAETA